MSWYEKKPETQEMTREAGAMKTMVWLSLIALLDITVVFPMVNKMGINIREMRQRMNSQEGQAAQQEAQQILKEKDFNPKAAEIYEKAIQEVSSLKREPEEREEQKDPEKNSA